MSEALRFTARLETMRIEEGYAPVAFVSLTGVPAEAAAAHELTRRVELGKRRGFGSVKVTAQVGRTRWRTSLFPRKPEGWFLPIKQAVRVAEGVKEGDAVEVVLELD